MRKLLFFSTIILIPIIGISQENNEDLALFNKGNALYKLVYEDLDFDYDIKSIDSTSTEGKVKIDLLKEQKVHSSLIEPYMKIIKFQ